ncbi:MAG TPA: L,D-transpeptidase family protein [Ferruginibacter sp.]|nr:L,D-transpeptidase family protein [Ferruginibacter sp.]
MCKKILSFFLFLVILNSCASKKNEIKKQTQIIDQSIPGNFSSQTLQFLDSTSIQLFLDSFPGFSAVATDMHTFYTGRNFSFAWFDSSGMIEQAGNLFNRVKNITDDGIDSNKMMYRAELSNLMDNPSAVVLDSNALKTELMLTAQYLTYAKTVWAGIDEKQSLALEWLLPRNKISYNQMLDSLLSGKDVLNNPPVYRQYYMLKEFLIKYRAVEKEDINTIITKLPLIKKGDSTNEIGLIRKKLFLMQDIVQNNGSNVFDEELENGVKSFQDRVGLKTTGTIKKDELKELNISIRKRIENILVNMERSRWVTKDAKGTNYIVVNIPEYKLHIYENDTLAWDMNVVVGKNQSKTVVFNGDIKYVVFAPYWNIPSSILKNEVLPGIKKNKNYLAKHNMEWNGGNVRQKPGKNNSLGVVKFLFPNSHSIYLHDSPAKSLFNETNRAFSHGCIRVADAKKLAEYLLRKDSTWSSEKIQNAMNSGSEKYVTLKQTVPVFIVYFTSWVGSKSGKLNFRKDIYYRNDRLLKMLIQ